MSHPSTRYTYLNPVGLQHYISAGFNGQAGMRNQLHAYMSQEINEWAPADLPLLIDCYAADIQMIKEQPVDVSSLAAVYEAGIKMIRQREHAILDGMSKSWITSKFQTKEQRNL